MEDLAISSVAKSGTEIEKIVGSKNEEKELDQHANKAKKLDESAKETISNGEDGTYGNEQEKNGDDKDAQINYPETENEETEIKREEAQVEVKLIDDDSVAIDIKSDEDGVDSATLPLRKQKSAEAAIDQPQEKQPPMMLFPLTRLKLAWTSSSNTCEFMIRAIFIIFSTVGWLFFVGGIPFIALAELIIGSVYVNDCRIQPNIPVYLIVTGVFGTVQHAVAVYTKYLPKKSQGSLRVYRAYCKVIDNTIQLFLFVWFVVGCIWIYGVHKTVDYDDPLKDEYCHRVVYLFAFWIFNLSFICLAILVVTSLCCILCVATVPKNNSV